MRGLISPSYLHNKKLKTDQYKTIGKSNLTYSDFEVIKEIVELLSNSNVKFRPPAYFYMKLSSRKVNGERVGKKKVREILIMLKKANIIKWSRAGISLNLDEVVRNEK